MMLNFRLSRLFTVTLLSVTLFCLLAQPKLNHLIAEALTATPSPTPPSYTPCPIDINDEYLLTVDKTAVSIGDIITISHDFAGASGHWLIKAGNEMLVHYQDQNTEMEWHDTVQLRHIASNQYEVIDGGDIVLQLSGVGEVSDPCGQDSFVLRISSPPVTVTNDDSLTTPPDLTITSHSLAFDDRGCNITGVAFRVLNQSAVPAPSFEVEYVDTGEVKTVAGLTAGQTETVIFDGGDYYGGLPSAIVDPSNLIAESDETNNEFVPEWPFPIPTRPIHCLTPEATTPAPHSNCITRTPTPTPDNFRPTATRDHTPTPTPTHHPDCPTAIPSPTSTPDCISPTPTPDNIYPTSTPHPDCLSANPTLPDLTIVSHNLAFDDRGCSIFGVQFTIVNQSAAPAALFQVEYVDTGEIQTFLGLAAGETVNVVFEGGNYYGGLPSANVDPSNMVPESDEMNNKFVPQWPLPIPTQPVHCLTPEATTTTPTPLPTATRYLLTCTAPAYPRLVVEPLPAVTNTLTETVIIDLTGYAGMTTDIITVTLESGTFNAYDIGNRDFPIEIPITLLPNERHNLTVSWQVFNVPSCNGGTHQYSNSTTQDINGDLLMIAQGSAATNTPATPIPTNTFPANSGASGTDAPLSVGVDVVEGETAVPTALILFTITTALLLAGSYLFARKR